MDLSDTSVTNESSDAAEVALVARILSWLFLLGFLLIIAVARGIYSSHDAEPSQRFNLVFVLGFMTFMWYWLTEQCRPYRASFPLDIGWFLSGLWVILAPYYLWRYQRWRGLAKFVILLAAFAMMYPVTLVVHFLLVGLE